jgi:hypothetical protein
MEHYKVEQKENILGEIIQLLLHAWDEHSLFFVFMSALIGGLIGASVKLCFEFLIPETLKARREANQIVSRYSAPLARSISALTSRIDNLLFMVEYKWFDENEYYRLSTLYIFCEYFAWRQILLGELTRLRYESSKKNRRFILLFNNVEKAFNNRSYFGDLPFNKIPDYTDVPKYVCKALGELMIVREKENQPLPVSFVDFCDSYRENKKFAEWVLNLEKFLFDLSKSDVNFKWDRLVIIRLSLSALQQFVDPNHEICGKLSPSEADKLVTLIQRPWAKDIFLTDCINKNLPIGIGSIELTLRRFIRKICKSEDKKATWILNQSSAHSPENSK